MLRRFLSSRNAFRRISEHPNLARRNISAKDALNRVVDSGPPVLARFPRLYSAGQKLKFSAGALLLLHIFVDYFYAIHGTWGASMVPTLSSLGDTVLISKYYRHGRGLKVGDIVSFVHPYDDDARACKRVIGMPGDFVLRDTPEKGKGLMIQVF